MASLRPYGPPVAWALLTLGLYAIPGRDMPSHGFWDVLSLDKIGHFGVFAVLSCTWIIAFRKQSDIRALQNRAALWSVIGCGIYGAVLEWMQGQVFSERTSDWMDLAANVVGVLGGVLLFRLIYRKC